MYGHFQRNFSAAAGDKSFLTGVKKVNLWLTLTKNFLPSYRDITNLLATCDALRGSHIIHTVYSMVQMYEISLV